MEGWQMVRSLARLEERRRCVSGVETASRSMQTQDFAKLQACNEGNREEEEAVRRTFMELSIQCWRAVRVFLRGYLSLWR